MMTYESKTGQKYKITPSHFLGNIADCFGYLFTIDGAGGEFRFIIRLPRDIALKKWKLSNRKEEEAALVDLGYALSKRELDRGNERDNAQITLPADLAKETLKKTLALI